MVYLQQISFALAGSILFLSLVEQVESTKPTFEFPPCVSGCILDSDCLPNNGNCMCKRARGDFLDKVLRCMDANCHTDLRNYEDSFLDSLEDGCDERDQDIPSSKLKTAKALAKSLLSKPSATTATANTVTASPSKITSTLTTLETRPASSGQEEEIPSPTSASTVDRNAQPGSTSASSSLLLSTQPATPSSSPDTDAIPPPLTDTSPFTNNNPVSTGSQTRSLCKNLGSFVAAAVVWVWV
ncbi:hypothetical protein QBC40DRAFT_285460 [Triangularia verruculosa]|uniref:Extracellular membrane protein CFEM domain-containing protein n=1 Tax=Triangularia verruculosa TaxID=2587418 RepID=A0AAN6XGT2_9PEZI|nr:hypothetical protein QBC40DRAFT_285460 [Triangularia verruculosa]